MEFSCYDIKELVFDMNLRENSGLVVKSLRVHFKQKQVGSDHTRCCQAATIPATIAGMPLYGFHACPVLDYSSHDIDIPRSNTSYSSIWYILYRESWKKGMMYQYLSILSFRLESCIAELRTEPGIQDIQHDPGKKEPETVSLETSKM